ncbi:hypothetical protein R1sor_026791 [Riccia sorocarpa]|uniref:SAP domain-containing protein n=1 Tax=Riccia sorocarpa TaxID=122646 RepID=A0ABD3GCD1_9MARC
MTRPPRPKYPSDSKNYHETRRPGFLFEAAEPAIASVLQERSDRVVIEQDSIDPVDVKMQCDPDGDVADEIGPDMSDSGNSDGEIEEDPGQVAVDSEDDDPSCCADSQARSTVEQQLPNYPEATYAFWSKKKLRDFCRENTLPMSGTKLALVQRVSLFLRLSEAGGATEIQRQRPLKYPELAQHDLAYKLKSWIYTCCKNAATRGDTTPQLLTTDVQNAADHWAGDHTVCRTLPGTRKSVTEQWETGRESKYTQGSLSVSEQLDCSVWYSCFGLLL